MVASSLEERIKLLEERMEQFEKLMKGCKRSRPSSSPAAEDDVNEISLRVGRKTFVTTKTTLRMAEEGSLLRMLAEEAGGGGGGIPFKRDVRGAYIIDRSEKHFHRVLDFLRSGPEAFAPPRGSTDRDELLTEARFYGLDCLAVRIDRPRMRLVSSLLNPEDVMSFIVLAPPYTKNIAAVSLPDSENYYIWLDREEQKKQQQQQPQHSTDKLKGEVKHIGICDNGLALDDVAETPLTMIELIHQEGGGELYKFSEDAFVAKAVCYCYGGTVRAPEKRLTPNINSCDGRIPPLYLGTGHATNEELLTSLNSLEHWKVKLLDQRPADVQTTELPLIAITLDSLWLLRVSPHDTLEIWPEPVVHSFTVQKTVDLLLSIDFHVLQKTMSNAGARIIHQNGGITTTTILRLVLGGSSRSPLVSVIRHNNGHVKTFYGCNTSTGHVGLRRQRNSVFVIVGGQIVERVELVDMTPPRRTGPETVIFTFCSNNAQNKYKFGS